MSKGRSKTVLVVERDPGLQGYLSALLTSQQYQIMLAVDCENALAAMDVNTPDLVLLGFNLAELSLREFLSSAQSHYPEVRIVMYSAMQFADMNNPFGVKYWAVKPYRASDLKSVLDMCFGGGTSALLRAVQDDASTSTGLV